MQTLLFGAGQIGTAIQSAHTTRPVVARIPWSDRERAHASIRREVESFARSVGDEPWALCWAAGRGVVGTPENELRVERDALNALLGALRGHAAPQLDRGRLLLVSSAGGLHAASSGVCTEHTPPSPVSDYGRSKLMQEESLREFAAETGVPVFLGRVSNSYGPGQDLAKPQGFISHLCRAAATRDTFILTVPPDTIRDFILNRDIGRRMVAWAESERPLERGSVTVKLLVSGRSTTLLHVVEMVRRITHVPVRLATRPGSANDDQPARTRFRSVVRTDLEHGSPGASLEEGIHLTWMATLRAATRPTSAAR